MAQEVVGPESSAAPPAPAATSAAAPPAASVVVRGALPEITTFRSLRHRNYRLLWFGTLFASSGQWIQQVTLGWLTYQLTGSAFLLGAINGFRSLPLLFLGPIGGVAADRMDRKRLMFSTQLFLMLSAALFATVIVSGHLRVWHIFVFTFFSGVGWAFNMPVRQSLLPTVVPREDLMNAMALNSAGFNLTGIVGPTVAGLMIAKFGAGENFYLQAFGYLCVSILVLQLVLPHVPRSNTGSVRGGLREGASFVWHHATLRTQMALALIPVMVALPYTALMPIFAKDVLHQGAGGFGVLMSAPGIGAVSATLVIASLGDVKHKGLLLLASIFTFGVALVAFSMSRSFPLSLVLLVVIGAVQMIYQTTNQTVVQLTTPDEFRGRVMGIYMLNQGLLPLGSLFAGAVADLASAPAALAIMGTAVAVFAAIFALRASSIRAL